MFTAAVFTTARTWKQPRRPSIDEWVKRMWYIHTMEYYSAIIMNESISVWWTNLVSLIEWSKSEREKQVLHINAYVWNLEKMIPTDPVENGHVDTAGESRHCHIYTITCETDH